MLSTPCADFLQRSGLSFFTNAGSAVFTHSYGYGPASRLTNVSDGTYSAAYSYVANSPLIDQITYRENSTVRMTRTNRPDNLNRLLEVSFQPSASGEKAIRTSYTYNQANQRIRLADTDGTHWLYDYDELGQLISGKRYWADSTPVAGQQFEYQFDDIGNRQTAKAGGNDSGLGLRQSDYSVNTLNQCVSRTVPGKVDIIGIAHAQATNTVNGQSPYRKGEYFWHELTLDNSSASVYAAVTNIAVTEETLGVTGNVFLARSPESFTYDADGNMTSDGRWTNRWDAENRLISMEALASVPSAARKKLVFTYDNQSRRISKTVSNWTGSAWSFSYTRKFVYDGWNLVAELDGNNNWVRSYLWGTDLSGSTRGAGGVGGLIAVKDAQEGTHFVCYDGNGNVTALVKATDGTTSTRDEYDPFGRTLRATGTLATKNPCRFSTKYTDDESGWLYYGYRFYDPERGRWPSRDPIGESGGNNVYVLAGNGPIDSTDSLGLCNFDSIDLGPRSGGQCGGFPADGCTSLDSWVLFSEVERCVTQCGYKVRITRCWAGASSWWDPGRAGSQLHEATHRFIWEQAWGDAATAARRLARGCFSWRRALCYRAAISLYRDAYQWDGAANNWEWDCALFGSAYPALCTNAQTHRAEASRRLAEAANKEAECDAMQ